jgi:hypothetical protein
MEMKMKNGKMAFYLLLLLSVLGAVLVSWFVHLGIRSYKYNELTKLYIVPAINTPIVTNALGNDIKLHSESYKVSTVEIVNNNDDYYIPLYGSKGIGKLHIKAKFIQRSWNVYNIEFVDSNNNSTCITLKQ